MGINQVISHIWARPRPSVSHAADVHLWFTSASTDPSFPSDHASAAFAVGFALLFVSSRWGIGMVLLAAAIAVSRVAIGLHYPGDVLAGMGVGLLAAFTIMYVARRPLKVVAAFAGHISDRVVTPVWNAAGRRTHRFTTISPDSSVSARGRIPRGWSDEATGRQHFVRPAEVGRAMGSHVEGRRRACVVVAAGLRCGPQDGRARRPGSGTGYGMHHA